MHPVDQRAHWLAQHVLPHEPALRSWLRKRRPAGLEVDDIVQETYARLSMLESIDHIRDARTYAFQIAHSVIVNFVRHSKVISIRAIERLDAFSVAIDEPDAETQISDRDELQRLFEAITSLSPKVREVFVLRRVDGLSQREVAKRLGLSESTVEKHMSKAFQELSQSFGHGGKLPRGASRFKQKSVQRIHGQRDKPED